MPLPSEKKPEIIVFAGPNGSGKSAITRMEKVIEPYINADDIKMTIHRSLIEFSKKGKTNTSYGKMISGTEKKFLI